MSDLHRRGTETALQSCGGDERLSLVFEDDGETGYLYVLDHTDSPGQPIKDALHLYNVNGPDVVEHSVSFHWSGDGKRCALFFGGTAVAFVDFATKQALSRSNFPEFSTWTQQARARWSDDAPGLVDKQ